VYRITQLLNIFVININIKNNNVMSEVKNRIVFKIYISIYNFYTLSRFTFYSKL